MLYRFGRSRAEDKTMRRRGSLATLMVSALWLLAVRGALASDESSVQGKWTVGGQTTEFRHLRTFREPEPFGHGTSPCLLASNEPVPDEAVPADDAGISKLLDKMRRGGLRALQVCFDSTGSKLRGVNDVFVFHPGISPGRFAFQGFHQLAGKPVAGHLAGRLTGSGSTNDGGAWSDSLTFDAPVPPEESSAGE